MTHPPALIRGLRFAALNSALRFRSRRCRQAIATWLAELAESTEVSPVGIETSTAVCSAARAALFLPSSGWSVPSGLLGPPGRTDMG